MLNAFKLALAFLGLSCAIIAQDKPAGANQNDAPPATAAPAPAAAPSSERNIRFQFDGIPYMDLVERFAQMANKPLISETNIQGTVTFNDPRPYNFPEAFEALNTILSMKDVMLVDADRFLRLVPFKDLPQMPLKIFRGLDKTGDVRPGEIVTVVMELKNLDPSESAKATSPMLSSAGSMAPLSRGRGLIITDRLENIRRIKQLLNEIDTSSPVQRQMRTYTLLHASGAVVADLINKTFGAATAPKKTIWNDAKKAFDTLPPDPEDYVTAVFDDASRTLLLFGPGERVALAEDLIHRFEDKEGGRGGEVKIFYPHSTKAEDLARMVRQAIPGVAAENETGSAAATKARVIVDGAMNRLIVTAPIAGQLDAIESLVNRVDGGGSGSLQETPSEKIQLTKVIRLNVADPSTAFRVLTNAFTRRAPNGNPVQAIKANLDAQTKTIVVTGSPGDLEHAIGIIDQMENIAPGVGPLETAFLEFPSASELKRVQPLVQQLYANQVADGTPGVTAHAKFIADPEARRLIVTASKEHQKIIKGIAEQLRAPAAVNQPREFRAITLKNVKVDQALKTITDLVNERMNDDYFRDVPKPLLLPDAPNNRLLITANGAQLKEIQDIVSTVDINTVKTERQFRSVKIYNRAPAEIATLADQLYREQLKGQPDPAGGAASFVAEAKGNRVIVTGSDAEVARAENIIRQLDPVVTRNEKDETRVLRLRNAQAQDLATLVEKSLGLEEQQVKLLVDPRSNSVVISGPAAGVASAAQMIEQLDVLPNTQPREVRMIELKSADARNVVPMLTDLLSDVMRNIRGSNYVLQSRIVADTNVNRVIVTGTTDELQQVNSLIARLDTAPQQADGTRIFQLNSTTATEMARIVSDAMTVWRDGGRRTRVRVAPDDRSNSLVVTGERRDLQDVQVIIEKLDGGEKRSGREVKVVELQSDEPAKLVTVAQEVWNAQNQGRAGLNDVSLTLDPSGKRVVIVGPGNLIPQVEQMLTGLDQKPDGTPRNLQVVELKGRAASAILPNVTRLYEEHEKGKKRRPATVMGDASGKRLMIYGSDEQVAALKEIIGKLEASEPGGDRETRLFDLGHPEEVARLLPLVQQLYREQMKDEPSDPADAQILGDERAGRLIITGRASHLKRIEAILAQLRQGKLNADNFETKIYNLNSSTAAELSQTVMALYWDEVKRNPALSVTQALILPDPFANRLIVSGSSNQLATIEGIVKQLDSSSPQTGGTRVFKLKASDATQLASVLSSTLVELDHNTMRSVPRVSVGSDTNSNSLVVSGQAKDLNAAAVIIEQLDSGTNILERQVRIVPVKNGRAAEFAQRVRALYLDHVRNQPASGPANALIMGDPAAERIVVAANAAQLEVVQQIIEQLDDSSALEGRQLAVRPLKRSSATSIATVIQQFFARNIATQDPAQRLLVSTAPDDRSLIIEGPEEVLSKVGELTDTIENRPSEDNLQVRSYQLTETRATELAPTLTRLYAQRRPNEAALQPRFEADNVSNLLLVAATSEQFDEINKLIEEVKANAQVSNEIRTFTLLRSDAAQIVPVLASMLNAEDTRRLAQNDDPNNPGPRRRSANPNAVRVAAAPAVNAVVVQGPPSSLKSAEQIIRSLDSSEGGGKTTIQTVRLKKAQAENVAEAVNQTLAARGPRSNVSRATVTPVSNSNTLLIDGPAESVQDVIKIIQELDGESTGGDIEIRVYKLEHGKARELSSLISRMLDTVLRESSRRSRTGSRGTEITVTADERTNSLIVSASPEQFKTVEQLLLTLDQNSAKTDRSVRFVILKNARALDLSSRLNLLFEGRPRGERPVIEADSFANSITIIGSKADIAEAESVISELDQVSRDQSIQVRMLVVDNVPAQQMAKMLQSLYGQMSQAEIQVVDRLTPPPAGQAPAPEAGGKPVVTISVDRTANALLMSGPSHELDAINSLVSELTFSSYGNDAEFRQFALKEADPVAVAKTLTELFKPETRVQQPAQPGQQQQVVTPAPKMTIVAEPRTRSIIARGKATDFLLLESLLQQLDVKSPSAQLAYRLVKLEHADPQKLLPFVSQMISQLGLTKPGDPVSVAPDLRSRGIFVVGRETILNEVEQVIKGLDTPPAFAEAEVALIALKHTVAAQLATILQNMLKPAASGEATEQARELQDQVRALRIKNEDGKEVVLDLSKPIRIMADGTPGTRTANRLVLSSTPDNIKALSAVVEMMDTVAVAEGVSFKIVRLENADASTVSETLSQIFAQGQRLTTGPAGPVEPASETGKALTSPLNISVDRRSNSLILSGKTESLTLAQRLIRDLDAESKGFVTEVKLFRLNYASAIRFAPLLQTVFTEAAPVPGTEGLTIQVTRLQTLLSTNNLDGKTTLQPRVRSALTIQADDPSNTLIVAARADIVPLIEEVIKTMDIPAASGMDTIRIYPLKNADASRLMRMINDIYAARGALMRPEEKPALTVDSRTNALIVSGNERVFALVETLIKQLDMDLPFEYGEFRVIKLENADAAVVATALQQIVNTRAQQKAAITAQSQLALRAIVIPDPRINSIIVGGSTEVFELVEALAKQLDQPGISLAGQIRLIPLQHANAGTLSTSLNNLFTQRYAANRSADVQRNRPIILPDARVNALLVSAGVEDNKVLDELLLKLDQKLEDPALIIEVIALQKNDAGRIAETVQTIFAGRLQAMTLPGQTPSPQDRVITSADPLSNALIVVANKENLESIRELVKKVDAEPPVEGGVLTIIPLKNADANRVAAMLRGLVSQGLYRPGMMSARGAGARAREAMAIAVDSRSNTLIVSASPENLAIIREVINQIDSQDYAREGDIRLYTLKHARASNLAQTLQQFFNSKRAGEAQGRENERALPTTILADDRVNTLLVTGGKEAFDAVERMLAQLDSEDIFDKIGFRIVTLKNSTAIKLQSTLTRLFANRPSRVAGKAPDPITIVADSWVNALLVGASVDDMDMVVNLIQTLDNTQPENGMQVQVIPIVKGDATAIAQTVRGLYREGPNTPVSVQVNADERLNALVVSAGEADLKRIVELVQKLDTTNVARVSEIRIFPLKFAQAEELSQVLTLALTGRPNETSTPSVNPNRQSLLQFITRTAEGEELVASALKESLLITADRRRNALVISAPADSMTLLARIVASLDSESPQLAKIRVFRLQNADARQMADVLTTLFRLKQQPGIPPNQRAIQYTLVRDVEPGSLSDGEPFTATIGSAEQYALSVTIDLRTNSLLLGGTDHYVGLASHIIEELDSSPALERRTEVYRLKNSQARDVETALKSFLQQERQRVTQVQGETLGLGTGPASMQAVGTALAGETVQQLIEREVAVVAETNSNTLLLSASPRYFDRFKMLIDELDQPQPQVLIQVILAEVTLDKTSELGVEWTVQGRKGGVSSTTGTDFGVSDQFKQFGGFSSAITGRDVSFVLRALEADGRLEVLSRPQILTADNQKATINVGQRVPLVTDSRVGGPSSDSVIINSYKYEDVGVLLTVTPKISPDGYVKMEVEPTVSQITSSEVTVSPGVSVPIIAQRKATTTVSVQNGQSVIIGGLISTSDDRRRRKVPVLGNIPYLGVLFRSSRAISDRKELLIILTPQLLLAGDDGKRLTEDQLRRTTIKDEIRRDKLQQEVLEPIMPLFFPNGSTNIPATNTVVLPPKAKTL